MTDPSLIELGVLGAGPKAAAVCAAACVARKLGLANVRVTVFEQSGVAAHWNGGRAGMTDGRQSMGTSLFKDVTFGVPADAVREYRRCLRRFSSFAYLYSRKALLEKWVNRVTPPLTHAEFADYLRWVFKHSETQIIRACVTRFTPRVGGVTVDYLTSDGESRQCDFDGFILTGPGEPRRISGGQDEDPDSIFDARSFWLRPDAFCSLPTGRVLVIGGGESAGSIAKRIDELNPGLTIDMMTPDGALHVRAESESENSVYSCPPPNWSNRSFEENDRFIRRTDRGVISRTLHEYITRSHNILTIAGRVETIQSTDGGVRVNLSRGWPSGSRLYDKVVVCIGFDSTSLMRRLLPANLRDGDWLADMAKRPVVDHHLRLSMPLDFAGQTVIVPVHAPMLAGHSQGPGFPNLSCLGLTAWRILSAYVCKDKLYSPKRSVEGALKDQLPA